MKKIAIIFCMAMLALGLTGCSGPFPNVIIISSYTTVGFDVSQSSTTQTPQATLAYKRSELAIVPCPTNGVVPDVLMDFSFKTDLFSSNGGIYSRVATGQHAISQTSATMMMAKDKNGTYPTNSTFLNNILTQTK